jgi:nucleotide-binding universal stress UspA family protein
MATFQNILLPVDFSEGSLEAVRYGRHFAQRSNGCVHLLNVVMDPGIYLPDASLPVVVPPAFLNDARKAAETSLSTLLAADEVEGFTVTREVIIDSPAEGIVQSARSQKSDLICIGTHGRTGFSRLAMGSVAERVVQHAPCPVLAVRGHDKGEVSIRRILLAVDFSDFTPSLLKLAQRLAADESAEIDLVHVVEEYTPNRSEFCADQPIVHDYLESIRIDAERRLAALDVPYAKVARHVLIGRPFVELMKHASDRKIDLILLGTHGRTGLPHWFLGSVAEMVVRKASCPVLVTPLHWSSAGTS